MESRKALDVSLFACWFSAPPEDQEGQSEEEILKQKTKERARKEFLGAVASEGQQNNCDIMNVLIGKGRTFGKTSQVVVI